MATFEAALRTKKEFNKVYIRISHRSRTDYIPTTMICPKSSIRNGKISDSLILANCAILINSYIEKINRLNIKNWTVQELKKFLMSDSEDISFIDFADNFIKKMIRNNRDKPAKSYYVSVCSLKKHFNKENILFSDITANEIRKWIQSLDKTARAKQLYPTQINKIFKAGIEEYNEYERDLIRIKYNPFDLIKIPSADVPRKRFADLDIVRKIFETKPIFQREEQAQDVVMLILCLAGINTIDLYNIEKKEFINGKFCYNRSKEESMRKDKAHFEIRVPDKILPLVEKHKGKKNLFVFRERYTNADGFSTAVNKGLKSICERAGIKRVTAYWFRHTWATVARNECGASIEEVAFCLNHASAHRVTETYIEKDFSMVDVINAKVIDKIFSKE